MERREVESGSLRSLSSVLREKFSFVGGIFKSMNRVEYSLKDIVLPKVMSYGEFADMPQADFKGNMVSWNPKNAQFVYGMKPVFTLVDLAKTYTRLFDDKTPTLLVFGEENIDEKLGDEQYIKYYFITAKSPYNKMVPTEVWKIDTKDSLLWGNDNAIKSRIDFVLKCYYGHTAKIVYIGSPSKYFGGLVENMNNRDICKLFDSTPILQSSNKRRAQNIALYGLALVAPLFISYQFFSYISSDMVSIKQKKFRNLQKELHVAKTEYESIKRKHQEIKGAIILNKGLKK